MIWHRWGSHVLSTPPGFISAVVTTRTAARGFENQDKFEFWLNLELGKAVKERGSKGYFMIFLMPK